jgi:hypothetical protein
MSRKVKDPHKRGKHAYRYKTQKGGFVRELAARLNPILSNLLRRSPGAVTRLGQTTAQSSQIVSEVVQSTVQEAIARTPDLAPHASEITRSILSSASDSIAALGRATATAGSQALSSISQISASDAARTAVAAAIAAGLVRAVYQYANTPEKRAAIAQSVQQSINTLLRREAVTPTALPPAVTPGPIVGPASSVGVPGVTRYNTPFSRAARKSPLFAPFVGGPYLGLPPRGARGFSTRANAAARTEGNGSVPSLPLTTNTPPELPKNTKLKKMYTNAEINALDRGKLLQLVKELGYNPKRGEQGLDIIAKEKMAVFRQERKTRYGHNQPPPLKSTSKLSPTNVLSLGVKDTINTQLQSIQVKKAAAETELAEKILAEKEALERAATEQTPDKRTAAEKAAAQKKIAEENALKIAEREKQLIAEKIKLDKQIMETREKIGDMFDLGFVPLPEFTALLTDPKIIEDILRGVPAIPNNGVEYLNEVLNTSYGAIRATMIRDRDKTYYRLVGDRIIEDNPIFVQSYNQKVTEVLQHILEYVPRNQVRALLRVLRQEYMRDFRRALFDYFMVDPTAAIQILNSVVTYIVPRLPQYPGAMEEIILRLQDIERRDQTMALIGDITRRVGLTQQTIGNEFILSLQRGLGYGAGRALVLAAGLAGLIFFAALIGVSNPYQVIPLLERQMQEFSLTDRVNATIANANQLYDALHFNVTGRNADQAITEGIIVPAEGALAGAGRWWANFIQAGRPRTFFERFCENYPAIAGLFTARHAAMFAGAAGLVALMRRARHDRSTAEVVVPPSLGPPPPPSNGGPPLPPNNSGPPSLPSSDEPLPPGYLLVRTHLRRVPGVRPNASTSTRTAALVPLPAGNNSNL